MGRHRSDPLGLARLFIAGLAIALAAGLLILGGVALWGALTKDTAESAPSATASVPADPSTPSKTPSETPSAPSPSTSPSRHRNAVALAIRCLAAHCKVYVAGPGPQDVRFNGLLSRGERRTYDQKRLSLVVADASGVEIVINGAEQPRGAPGRKTYRIVKR